VGFLGYGILAKGLGGGGFLVGKTPWWIKWYWKDLARLAKRGGEGGGKLCEKTGNAITGLKRFGQRQ